MNIFPRYATFSESIRSISVLSSCLRDEQVRLRFKPSSRALSNYKKQTPNCLYRLRKASQRSYGPFPLVVSQVIKRDIQDAPVLLDAESDLSQALQAVDGSKDEA